jgi:hypothetical protein
MRALSRYCEEGIRNLAYPPGVAFVALGMSHKLMRFSSPSCNQFGNPIISSPASIPASRTRSTLASDRTLTMSQETRCYASRANPKYGKALQLAARGFSSCRLIRRI